jgi:Uma2 family endonuclease
MLEEELLLPVLTEDDLPDSDEKPVDNELQVLAPALLRAILAYIWAERFDWFFGINLGIYYDTNAPAIGPDGFLSLGAERVRANGKLRLSYVLAQEKVMPQWVLEVVSKQPGGEYGEKFQRYAAMGVLYYTIYNPSHHRRDKHDIFEVYKLTQGKYVRQQANPVWMPEIGLGIGHEVGRQDGIERDWLYWYDAAGDRHLAPEDALSQERILRGREQLMRQQLEAELSQERIQRSAAEQELAQERQSMALKMLEENIPIATIARITELTINQLQDLQSQE